MKSEDEIKKAILLETYKAVVEHIGLHGGNIYDVDANDVKRMVELVNLCEVVSETYGYGFEFARSMASTIVWMMFSGINPQEAAEISIHPESRAAEIIDTFSAAVQVREEIIESEKNG
ncbi:MAG: hypothetical protein L0J73_00085 [Halomonas sp.]|nr:hypothetical protein [Halomonas sp.]